jgi:hypothetical protein
MPRCRIEGREKDPLKTLEKLGCEKYAKAKIARVNTVYQMPVSANLSCFLFRTKSLFLFKSR